MSLDFKNEMNEKVNDLLSKMTLEEKVGQLVQYAGFGELTGPNANAEDNAKKIDNIKKGLVGSMLNVMTAKQTREYQEFAVNNSRLGIPMIFAYDVIHGFKTMFPITLGETASWDLEVMEAGARVAAIESAAYGLHWTFAPMMDLSRDARWGRVMEGAGEDPYLTSLASVARIKGFQGEDLADERTIAACAKHFAAYGLAEGGRDYNTVDASEHTLRNFILPPFKAAAEAGVATFMNAFNEIGGVPATASVHLQRNILKGEWNYEGFVVSDWGSILELINHRIAKDKTDAARLAIIAGSDMDMEGFCYETGLVDLVNDGIVKEELVDDAVSRILKIKYALGLFDDPFKYCNEDREKNEVYTPEHLAIARDAARKSIVLLKNETNLLPLSKDISSIAVIGPFAADKDVPIGSWRAQAETNSAVSLLEGIQHAVGNNTTILHAKGVQVAKGRRSFVHELEINHDDTSPLPDAVAVAKEAEVVILAIGEDCFQSGEGRSQVNISLSKPQQALLEAVYAVNKNIIVTLMNGRPLEINWMSENVPTILETWHLGSESGNAIADVIFGDYNPSGKLPMSFPRHVGQCPIYYNHKSTGRPDAIEVVFWSHYIDEKNTPLYPFGFGLSYTTFEYRHFKLDKTTMAAGEKIIASVEVANTGTRDGEEVIQLYIQDVVASVTRPVKELKGFEKVMIKAGEVKTITFEINEETLSFYRFDMTYGTEPGEFKVMVGGNSVDLLEASFTLL